MKYTRLSNIDKNKLLDAFLFIVLFFIYSSLSTTLFWRQISGILPSKSSDFYPYIQYIKGAEIDYRFPYPIFFAFSKYLSILIHDYNWGTILSTAIFNSATALVCKFSITYLTKTYYKELYSNAKSINILVTALTFILLYTSMLLTDFQYKCGIIYPYAGVFSGNPWHNATYIAAKPFMVLSFTLFIDLIEKYEKEGSQNLKKEYISFSLLLLLSTMTKPSYTLIQLLLAFVILFYKLLKSRLANIKETILFSLCYIPTIIDMLYQYRGVFASSHDENKGIGIAFAQIWSLYSHNIPLSIVLANAFPLIVLFLHINNLKKHTLLKSAWIFWSISLLSALLLYEKGFRSPDFNFAWGYMCGIFLVFFTSIIIFIEDLYNYIYASKGENQTLRLKYSFLIIPELFILLYHFCCGCIYFSWVYMGLY